VDLTYDLHDGQRGLGVLALVPVAVGGRCWLSMGNKNNRPGRPNRFGNGWHGLSTALSKG